MDLRRTPSDFHDGAHDIPNSDAPSPQSSDDHLDSRKNSKHDIEDIEPVEDHHADDSDIPELEQKDSSYYAAMRVSSRDPSKNVISFGANDPGEPNNWSRFWKLYAVFTSIMTVMNSTIASGLAAGDTEQISEHFGVTNQEQLVLPTSIYICGYVVGSILFGPLSEQYGRRITMIGAFFIFTVFSMASALAPNWPAFIIFRLIVGIAGSCPIAVVGGICADVYHDPTLRGRAMAVFMVATCWGPVLGPVASGYLSTISWNWPFWFGTIGAGATWPFLLIYRETFSPVLLRRRAAHLRKTTSDSTIYAPMDLESESLKSIITVILLRALKMLVLEPLITFTCLYLSIVYALFYIFFQSFPIIYGGIYAFTPGQTGLAFIPIGIGALIACPMYLYWDVLLSRAQTAKRPWALREESRRLPLACIAGPFLILSIFWSGFTARPDIHWAVPAASGIPFGIGYLLLFMGMLNYLVDAYEIYAASASAAASASRSTFGAVLPFAAKPMYDALGVRWASGTLGFISAAIAVVPFVFLVYGPKLREKSPFCRYLAEMRRKEEERKLKMGKKKEADREEGERGATAEEGKMEKEVF